MMNEEWARWITASINQHFDKSLVKPSLNFVKFFEGNHRAIELQQSIIEVRTDGGYWTEQSKDRWVGIYEVNLLVQYYMDDKDNYKVWDLIGLCNKAMSQTISIFKYGGDTGDDSFLECFQRLKDKEEIITHFFGQIDPKVNLIQATIEAHYSIELES